MLGLPPRGALLDIAERYRSAANTSLLSSEDLRRLVRDNSDAAAAAWSCSRTMLSVLIPIVWLAIMILLVAMCRVSDAADVSLTESA